MAKTIEKCQKCESKRLLQLNHERAEELLQTDFVNICLDCGQVQGKFPISDKKVAKVWADDNNDWKG